MNFEDIKSKQWLIQSQEKTLVDSQSVESHKKKVSVKTKVPRLDRIDAITDPVIRVRMSQPCLFDEEKLNKKLQTLANERASEPTKVRVRVVTRPRSIVQKTEHEEPKLVAVGGKINTETTPEK